MAVIPNPITPLPTPPSTADPANFDVRADAFLGALPEMVTQVNSNNSTSYNNAVEAANSTVSANTAKTAAETAATNANTAKTAAETAATNANTAKTAAETANTDIQKYYLGRKSTPPTTDNQGNPLQAGAWYTNTNGTWYWWNGSWVPGVGDIAGSYLPLSGGIMQGPVSVPANATGSQAPRASEVTSRTATVYDQTALMSAAPLNQWAAYISATGVGSDWPPGHPSVNAWDVITFGQTGRVTQIASQAFSGIAENAGAMFVRTLHDSTWGAWSRVITDRTVMEREVVVTVPAGTTTYAVDPWQGSVHYITINGPVTFNLPAQGRQFGDQVTLRILSNGGVRPITLSSNAYLPVGQSLPTYAAGQIVTLTFFYGRAGAWDCFIGGVHQ